MDARAYLTSQGWRGAGHSLHATDDKIGLSKPLLLNRRDGNKGLGQKAHFTSDTWWMNAFDEQLQGLSSTTGKDGKVGVVQTVTQGRINRVEQGQGGRWSLGGNFVRGGFLEGTIELLQRDSEGSSSSSSGGGEDETGTSTPAVEEVNGAAEKEKGESKEEKKRRRADRAARRAEKEARRKRKEAEKAGKTKSQSKSKPTSEETSPDRTSGTVKSRESKKSRRDETKEERRARKEAKRLKRAVQKSG